MPLVISLGLGLAAQVYDEVWRMPLVISLGLGLAAQVYDEVWQIIYSAMISLGFGLGSFYILLNMKCATFGRL